MVEGTDLGGDAMLPILADAGIPLVGHVQFGPARMFDENSYLLRRRRPGLRGRRPAVLRRRGRDESVMWFLPDEPSSHAFTDASLDADRPTRWASTTRPSTTTPASPNWAVLATTAVAENPDVSGSIAATDAQCAEMIGALRDAGYQGRILAASCCGLYDALGDEAVGVDTDADHWNPGDLDSAPAAKQAELEEYAAVMRGAGHEDLVAGNAIISFADVINLTHGSWPRSRATIDGAAVAGALRGDQRLRQLRRPDDHLRRHGPRPATRRASTDLLFFQVQDDGSVAGASPTTSSTSPGCSADRGRTR